MDQIRKKVSKLRSMTAHEIRLRLRGYSVKLIELIRYRMNINKITDEYFYRAILSIKTKPFDNEALIDRFNEYPRDRFFTEMYDKRKRLAMAAESIDESSWIEKADRLLEGRIKLLGHELTIPHAGGWHVDPIEGDTWRRCFYVNVKKQDSKHARDIKYIWEINRHQYLIVLAKAYWLSGDERYAGRVVDVISSWIDENPSYEGVNWTSSLELAVRTISWIWSYFLCKDCRSMTYGFQKRLFKSIYEHGRYIADHLSYYESPYNHLVGEAAALHLIGSLFPMFNTGKKWEHLGWSILSDRVDGQFHDDGMCVEQASFYHHFTLGFYLQSIFLRRNNKKTISEKVCKYVESALEFSMHLTRPDGTLPMIGDIDNARSLFFDSTHSWDFRSYLSLGAVLFNRSDFKGQAPLLAEELFWMASEGDVDQYVHMKSEVPKTTAKSFEQSGYFISRDNWSQTANYFCFDCGELSAGLFEQAVPSAAHGHADALSFELVVCGKPFLVDGGFFTYFGAPDWHKYFRHEEAHNTVLIDNGRQAEYSGRLTWQRVRRPDRFQYHTCGGYDAVSGRVSYGEIGEHIRQLTYMKGKFLFLRDIIRTPDNKAKIRSFLHFSPQVELSLHEDRCLLDAEIENNGLLIYYPKNVDVSVHKGGDDPACGWVAEGYGMKQSAWVAVFQHVSNQETSIIPMIIVPYDKSADRVEFEGSMAVGNNFKLNIDILFNTRAYRISTESIDGISVDNGQEIMQIRFT